jgi:hypothetical protein
MKIRDTIVCASRTDIKNYFYFIVSTGLFQTYRGWVSMGRANPLLKVARRKEATTRAEIADIFKLSRLG